MDGEAEQNFEHVVVGGGDDGPASELGSTKEEGEHRIEEKHLEEDVFPFFEPFFGVREEIGDEGKWSNHDKDGDDALA